MALSGGLADKESRENYQGASTFLGQTEPDEILICNYSNQIFWGPLIE